MDYDIDNYLKCGMCDAKIPKGMSNCPNCHSNLKLARIEYYKRCKKERERELEKADIARMEHEFKKVAKRNLIDRIWRIILIILFICKIIFD